MKKIGILTFQNADNYGALLQAYALKTVLLSLGTRAEVLNYRCPKLEREYRFFSNPQLNLKWLLVKTIKLFFLPFFLYKKSLFGGFRKQYLTDTIPLYPQTICNIAGQYDAFISGSDQVFNPRLTDFDTNYFLAFNPQTDKNYSYAASFGLQQENLTEKERAFMIKNLKHIAHLSVREQQGSRLLKTLTNQACQVHIDPTLLLTTKQWEQVAVVSYLKKYVLLYLMHRDGALIHFAQQLAADKGLELVLISPMPDLQHRIHAKHIAATVEEWIGLFLHAQYVVTNSFHGLAFSIAFNKTFFISHMPAKAQSNSRFDHLLSLVGLSDRFYTNFQQNYDKTIDWNLVNSHLEKERQKSYSYLREITQ